MLHDTVHDMLLLLQPLSRFYFKSLLNRQHPSETKDLLLHKTKGGTVMKKEHMKISTMHSGLCGLQKPSQFLWVEVWLMNMSKLCTSEYCSIVIWFCLKIILTNVQYQATKTSVATEGRVQENVGL